MKEKLIISLLFLVPVLAGAQSKGKVSFEAFTDAKQVVLNGYFDVTFTLKNGDGNDFRPPSFNNFIVASGPSRSVRTTIRNGQYSQEISYSYVLQPRARGKYIIGSASIKVAGQEYKTDPMWVEVVEGNPTNIDPDEAKNVYVKAEPSTTEAWVGQQIILDYKLYTTVNIDNYNILQESEYPGFFAKNIKRYDSRVVRQVINGVQFVTKVLRRVALYPQQAGPLTVDPMNIQLGVVVEDPNRKSSYFFGRQTQRMPAMTEALTINVRPLPQNPPASFTGAVGKFEMNPKVSRTNLTTDDALSLKITISGNGDIKRVQAPQIDFSDKFEQYDPKILDESTYEINGEVSGKKTFEYLVVPIEPGNYKLQPTFTYFDTDSSKYVTIDKYVFNIFVRQGSNRRTEINLPTEEEIELEDIRFIKTDTSIAKAENSFFSSIPFWVLTGLPLLLLGAVIVFRQQQIKRKNIDPSLVKSRRARKIALSRLSVAEEHLKAEKSRAFYDEVSKAMLGYVCDKLQIPRSELTKDNVRGKLEALDVRKEPIERFMKIIHTAEMALFAGMDNTKDMKETYTDAVEVLSDIEESVG